MHGFVLTSTVFLTGTLLLRKDIVLVPYADSPSTVTLSRSSNFGPLYILILRHTAVLRFLPERLQGGMVRVRRASKVSGQAPVAKGMGEPILKESRNSTITAGMVNPGVIVHKFSCNQSNPCSVVFISI